METPGRHGPPLERKLRLVHGETTTCLDHARRTLAESRRLRDESRALRSRARSCREHSARTSAHGRVVERSARHALNRLVALRHAVLQERLRMRALTIGLLGAADLRISPRTPARPRHHAEPIRTTANAGDGHREWRGTAARSPGLPLTGVRFPSPRSRAAAATPAFSISRCTTP